MASGWNLWVWLPCIGVVSGCRCKEVYRYTIIIIFPTPLVLALFLAAASLLLCSFLKCFFGLYIFMHQDMFLVNSVGWRALYNYYYKIGKTFLK